MGGGGGQTVQSSDPWAGQQPYLTDLMANAQNLFRQGYGQEYYPGQTVAPFSPQTQMAMDLTTQQALQGSPQQAAMGRYLTGTMMQPMVNPYAVSGGAQQLMGGIAPGQELLYAGGQPTDIGTAARIAGFAGGAGGVGEAPGQAASSAALNELQRTATGGYMPGANPYLDQVYGTAAQRLGEQFQENVLPGIAAQFGSAGRTGSGAQALMLGRAAGEQADALARLGADVYAPAYEAERARQQQAAMDLYGTGTQADISRRQLMGDIYQQGLGRAVTAGGQLGQLGLGGMGGLTDLYGAQSDAMKAAAALTPAYQQMQYGDIDRLMGVGAQMEDQTQRMIDAAVARHQFGQQAPWQALGQYSNIVTGMPAGLGTQTTTTPQGSRILGGLGGAATGAAAGSMFGPYGAAIGGGLGLVGGLFG